MKPFIKLRNTERAKLLFELFPKEMPCFIAFSKELTQQIIDDPDKLKTETIDQIRTTYFWYELVTNAKRKLELYGNKLAKRSRLFSDQLFDGYDSIYARYCLQKYIISDNCTNRKFKEAVMLLFF